MDIQLDFLLQLDGIGPNKLIDLYSVLENHESWHSTNAILLCKIREFIDVHFDVIGVRILLGQFNDFGGDNLNKNSQCCSLTI